MRRRRCRPRLKQLEGSETGALRRSIEGLGRAPPRQPQGREGEGTGRTQSSGVSQRAPDGYARRAYLIRPVTLSVACGDDLSSVVGLGGRG